MTSSVFEYGNEGDEEARREEVGCKKLDEVLCWSELVSAHFGDVTRPVCVTFAGWRNTQKALRVLGCLSKKQWSKKMARRRELTSPKRSYGAMVEVGDGVKDNSNT